MSRSVIVVLSRLQRRDYYHLLDTANELHKKVQVSGEIAEEKLEEATLRAVWHILKHDENFNGFSIEDKRKTVAFVYHNVRFLQSNTRRTYSVRDMKAVKQQKHIALIKTYTKSEYVPGQQHMVKKVPCVRETPSPVNTFRVVPTAANTRKGRSLETPPPDHTPKEARISRDAHAASLTLPENRGNGTLGLKGLMGSVWAT